MKYTTTSVKYFLLLVGAASILYGCGGKKEDSGSKGKGKGPLEVNATIVKKAALENEITVNGSIMANEQVELKAESQGKLVVLNLNEGASVKKGELLAKLNDADLQATLSKLKIQEKQQAADERRKKELLAVNGISQQEYEQARTTLDATRADIQMTQAQIAKTEIRAPFNGTVGLRSVSPGAFVSQTSAIAKLVQTNPLKIEFNTPERYAATLKKGDNITFTVEGKPKEYSAKIYAIEPGVDELSRTVKMRGYAANADNLLLPGAFIKVKLQLTGGANIVLPAGAIVPQLGSQNVYRVVGGMATLTKVTLGFRTGTEVEVVNGLSVGDSVITTGLLMVKDQMPVKVVGIDKE